LHMPSLLHLIQLPQLAIATHGSSAGSVAMALATMIPWLLALLTRPLGRHMTARLAWIPVGASVAAGIAIGTTGPSVAGITNAHGHLLAGLQANTYSITLIVLVTFVGALVQSFALRHLQSDTHAARFAAGAHVVVGAMVIVADSATLAGLVIGWVIAGMAFTSVLGYRPELPGVKRSVAATRRAFIIGDTALVVAASWIILRSGDVALTSSHDLQVAAGRLGAGEPVVALLVAVSALARSAQFPLGRWMAGTVNAPTPVSALLHAGVVNGGGILLVRMAPLENTSAPATLIVFCCAFITLAYGITAIRARSDVKGALALSTRAQMGFMLAECAAGLPVFATVHLIGHAIYKATLFFGSGNGIRRPGTRPIKPVHSHRLPASLPAIVAGIAGGGITLGTMLMVMDGLGGYRSWPLLLFSGVTATVVGREWWLRHPRGWGWPMVAAFVLVTLSAIYAALLSGLGGWLVSTLGMVPATLIGPWWLVVAGVTAAAFSFAAWQWLPMTALSILVPAGNQGDVPAPQRLAGLRLWRVFARPMVPTGDRQQHSGNRPMDGCAA
jgi:NADH:ubiquinone oxidoreductase subunit 5 (subunit L)/multisubunit Na+/H+ antiporter MnhA subunit